MKKGIMIGMDFGDKKHQAPRNGAIFIPSPARRRDSTELVEVRSASPRREGEGATLASTGSAKKRK